MKRTRFDTEPCPIARTTDLIGDWWTPLIMRQAFMGCRRFDRFQSSLKVPRAVLTARLKRLCDENMLERVQYQDKPVRFEYRLTEKGRDFWPVLAAMWRWGQDWLWQQDHRDHPAILTHSDTGAEIIPIVVDEKTGQPIDIRSTRLGWREP